MNTELLLFLLVGAVYLKWIFFLLIFPFYALYGYYKNYPRKWNKILALPYCGIERVFKGGGARYVLYNISFIPSTSLRKLLYKVLGAHIAPKVVIHFKTEIRRPNNLYIGKGSIIGDNALLDARSGIYIGENVNISSNVSIYTLQHDHRDSLFRCNSKQSMPVYIADRVWIGSNVIILPGVKIGEGAVCCAGCVITKDIEPYSVVAGIPAKKVGDRPHSLIYEFDGKSCWFY